MYDGCLCGFLRVSFLLVLLLILLCVHSIIMVIIVVIVIIIVIVTLCFMFVGISIAWITVLFAVTRGIFVYIFIIVFCYYNLYIYIHTCIRIVNHIIIMVNSCWYNGQWTFFWGLEYTYSKINTANLRVVLNDGDTTGSPSLYSSV